MPQSLAGMEQGERRRAALLMIGRVLVVWVVILGVYFLLPIGKESGGRVAVRLIIDVVALVAVIWWQARRILKADYPELRAMEALGVIVVFFLVIFAALYLAMSHASRGTFTQPLDHMRSLYFTMTVFSTVGFGDITPTTDAARGVVSLQMLLDLVLIAAVVRLLMTAVKMTGVSSSSSGG